jgi:tetratricopeptide (TPR) repeat protein
MNRKINILFVIVLLANTAFGQFVGKDDLSISLFYFQKAELDSSRMYIDKAVKDKELKKATKTWYYRGIIYKDIYKKKEKQNKISPARIEAIDAFKKTLELDTKKEFSESSRKGLAYLANTLYNDAARLLNSSDIVGAGQNYNRFRETMLIADTTVNLLSKDITFKMALASIVNRPNPGQSKLDSNQVNFVKSIFLEVLEIDPNNPAANYNLAILYYNKGADVINDMDFDMDIMKLNEVQDQCVELFLAALPYMKKAYDLNYKRKETLLGLSNIYYGLNDMEKSEAYKKELQDLENGQ